MTIPRKVLFVSNGHGEDAIAAGIVKLMPPAPVAEAYPTLGAGRAYDGICPIVGPRATLPSEGWRNVEGSFSRDVRGGGLLTLWPGLRFLRAARKTYDRVVVVGDMIGVYGCFLSGIKDIVYVDVYKTGFGSPYMGLDRFILKRTAKVVFSRSDTLAQSLVRAGIDARHAGNVMMDTIPRAGLTLERAHKLAVAVLPGSREHAVDNFALQAAAVSRIKDIDIFVAVAPGLELPAQAGMTFVRGMALGEVLDAADVVLSQAGTATVQAVGLGKPVITFRAPQDRGSRFEDEQRLFGEARQEVKPNATALADALARLLADPEERARRGNVGKARVGVPGSIQAIIAAI